MPELTEEAAYRLLPEAEPEWWLPAGVGGPDVERRLGEIDEFQRRVFRWLTVLQASFESEDEMRSVAGFQGATYGYIPVADDIAVPERVNRVGGYVFGTAIELEPIKEGPAQAVDQISVRGMPVARVFNYRELVEHVANPTMPLATGACWARTKKPGVSPAVEGVVTAGHVVKGVALRGAVSMSGAGAWNLGDRGSCKIDAALIVQAGCIPSGAARLRVQRQPVAAAVVDFTGVTSGPRSGRLTHVLAHPSYFGERHPMRVFFDTHGSGGDSGALVTERVSGDGVGIYMGRAPIPHSSGAGVTMEGVGQLLAQAETFFMAEFFV